MPTIRSPCTRLGFSRKYAGPQLNYSMTRVRVRVVLPRPTVEETDKHSSSSTAVVVLLTRR